MSSATRARSSEVGSQLSADARQPASVSTSPDGPIQCPANAPTARLNPGCGSTSRCSTSALASSAFHFRRPRSQSATYSSRRSRLSAVSAGTVLDETAPSDISGTCAVASVSTWSSCRLLSIHRPFSPAVKYAAAFEDVSEPNRSRESEYCRLRYFWITDRGTAPQAQTSSSPPCSAITAAVRCTTRWTPVV